MVSCSGASNVVKSNSQSAKDNVFSEVHVGDQPPQDYSILIIKVELKTCCKDFYLLGSDDSCAGKPKYPFLFNIDGQSVTWKFDGKYENTSKYDVNKEKVPDGGEDVRYSLEKILRLKAGKHKLFFALPSKAYQNGYTLLLKDGSQNILEFKPIYERYKALWNRSFLQGICHYDVFFNGNPFSFGQSGSPESLSFRM